MCNQLDVFWKRETADADVYTANVSLIMGSC